MTDWQAIDEELSHWQQPVQLWWRDDDATRPNAELDPLVELSEEFGIDLFLAVIPGKMEPSLADWLIQHPHSWVLQHGIRHENHALPEQRKIELGGSVASAEICAQLIDHKTRLADAFAERLLPVLVPPWNRIEPRIIDSLPDRVYSRLSVLGAAHRDNKLTELNVHLDIIDWQTRSFKGRDSMLDDFLTELRNRRLDPARRQEPIGLMTHHWIHDNATNDSLREFFAACAQRTKISWLSAASLLQH